MEDRTTRLSSIKVLESKDDLVALDADRLKPGESKTYYANGFEGVQVSIALERVPNSGGHYHGGATNNPLAVGTITK